MAINILENRRRMAMSQPHLVTAQSGNTEASAVIAHFRATENARLKNLIVRIPYTSAGVSTITVTHAGVNLLQCDTWSNGVSKGITMAGTKVDGEIVSISISGTATGDNCFRNLNYDNGALKLPPDGSYACYAYTDDAAIVYSGTPNNIYDRTGGTYNADVTGWRKYDLEPGRENTTEYMRLQLMPYRCNGKSFDTDAYPLVCLELDESCDFEPYCGQQYTITIPTAIYGGTVDLITGLVTGEYASDGLVLSSPVTQQITGQQITTLKGINNIWSNIGTIELAYWSH